MEITIIFINQNLFQFYTLKGYFQFGIVNSFAFLFRGTICLHNLFIQEWYHIWKIFKKSSLPMQVFKKLTLHIWFISLKFIANSEFCSIGFLCCCFYFLFHYLKCDFKCKIFSNNLFRLRKVKMDQRKLMDNANTITDMAKVRFIRKIYGR